MFDSEDETIINMFEPRFCYEKEKEEGVIPIKEDQLKDDPNDYSHPNSDIHSVDPHSLKGPIQVIAEKNWAWKFKYFDPQTAKENYQQFTDMQCIAIEYKY